MPRGFAHYSKEFKVMRVEKMLKAEASADGIPAKTITNKRLAAI